MGRRNSDGIEGKAQDGLDGLDGLDVVGVETLREDELDHAVVEAARTRGQLRSITLRLGVEQIQEARRESERTGIPYQVVLRRWISIGASAAQSARRKLEKRKQK